MYRTKLSPSGKSATIVDDAGMPAVTKRDGKPLNLSPDVAEERAQRMNADAERAASAESGDAKAYRDAAAKLTNIIDEADSRCQAQPIHRSRGVRAEGYGRVNGKRVKACTQCVAYYGEDCS